MGIRTNVFTDKASITIAVPRSDWDVSLENLHHVVHRKENLSPARGEKAYKHYRYAWRVKVAGKNGRYCTCLLQAGPISGQASFLRIEWNPSKVVENAITEIYELMARCVPNFGVAWHSARISRIDVTFDVNRLRIDEVLAFSASARTGSYIYRPKGQLLNAIYLGARQSNRRLVIYNKALHLARNLPTAKRTDTGNWAKIIRPEKTRFEFRIRDIGLISKLTKLANPLTRYTVALTHLARQFCKHKEWQHFLDRCVRYDAQYALALISDRKRRALYRSILRLHCTPSWFCPQKIWQEALRSLNVALTVCRPR